MSKKDITSNVLKNIFSQKLTKAKEGIAKQLRNKSLRAIEDYKNSFKFELAGDTKKEEASTKKEWKKGGESNRRCSGGDKRRKETKENLKNFKGKKSKPFKKEGKPPWLDKDKDDDDEDEKDEATGDKAAYKKFFDAKLKKYGVTSPSQLKGADEKKFYDEIDKEWEGDNEED